jgi:hypothetical protein
MRQKPSNKPKKEIPIDIVDNVILTDDFYSDNTVEIAKSLGLNHVRVRHKT